MQRLMILLIAATLAACADTGTPTKPSGETTREYAATSVSLSDFSMKIIAYYQSENAAVPDDFDTGRFFALLERIYPDQSRVSSVKSSFKVAVRPLDGGYSVMLCDLNSDRKIMEDLSCHLDRVEIRTWEGDKDVPCAFETNWKQYCQ